MAGWRGRTGGLRGRHDHRLLGGHVRARCADDGRAPFRDRRGWRFVTSPASLDADLRCASVPGTERLGTARPISRRPARAHRTLRAGGRRPARGGLGCRHQQGPDAPYAADELGLAFGDRYSPNAFQTDARQPIPLLVP
jgi:hypothetical protein